MPTPWGTLPASTLWSFGPHTKPSTNVGKAAGTFRPSRAPTESDHHKLSSAAHAMSSRGKKGCASHHARAALSSTNLRTASVTVADQSPSSDPPRPIQCSAMPALGRRFCVRTVRSCLKNPSRKSILFEYEMSRGLKFFSERKFQDHDPKIRLCLTHSKDFPPSF